MTLEREVKLVAPPGFVLPDLTAAAAGRPVAVLPEQLLQATYYDTADLRLVRWGVTLRHRTGDDGGPVWTVKVPARPAGEVVARNELVGTVLWRLSGPLSSTTEVTGLYPRDTWSTSRVTWRKLRCTGGELVVTLHSDPTLFSGQLTRVVASVGRRPVAATSVPPEGSTLLRVPVTPAGDTCVVRFSVSPTRVPAEVIPGATDERRLGVHFDAFAFEELA